MHNAARVIEGAVESEPPSRGTWSVPSHSSPAREAFSGRRRTSGGRELTDPRGTGIVLGELAAADRPRIAEILRSTRVFSAAEIDVALEVFDEGAAGRHYALLGAFSPEGALLGYACWGPTPATDRTWDLYWIAVDSGMQRAGVGTILLEEVERRLTSAGARLLVIETSSRSDYQPTREFYLRRGYAESARVRDFYAPGDDRIIFVKRIHIHSPGGGEQGRDE